jgi:hypothetical protein
MSGLGCRADIRPVVAGRLAREGSNFLFNYGRSYLARKDAISLYEPELPLRAGVCRLQQDCRYPIACEMLRRMPGPPRHHQSAVGSEDGRGRRGRSR